MEEWRDVPGYEGFYQVSDEGNVISLVRLTEAAVAAGVRKAKKSLAFGKNGQGRLQVTLCRDGVPRRFQVHRLVLMAFRGACPDGMEGRHLDGDHVNNRLGNLEWNTHLVNMHDKVGHGTLPVGEGSRSAKLTEADVLAIRASTDTHRALGVRYGVSGPCIHAIKVRKTWTHI